MMIWVQRDVGGHRATPQWTLHETDPFQPRKTRCGLWPTYPMRVGKVPPQGVKRGCKRCHTRIEA